MRIKMLLVICNIIKKYAQTQFSRSSVLCLLSGFFRVFFFAPRDDRILSAIEFFQAYLGLYEPLKT